MRTSSDAAHEAGPGALERALGQLRQADVAGHTPTTEAVYARTQQRRRHQQAVRSGAVAMLAVTLVCGVVWGVAHRQQSSLPTATSASEPVEADSRPHPSAAVQSGSPALAAAPAPALSTPEGASVIAPQWSVGLGPASAVVAVPQAVVLAGSRLVCREAQTGALRWQHPLAVRAMASSVTSTGAQGPATVVAVTSTQVVGFDAARGQQRWQHPLAADAAGPWQVLLSGGLAVVVAGPNLVVLQTSTGQVRWQTTVTHLPAATHAARWEQVAVQDGRLVATVSLEPERTLLVGWSLASANPRWSREFPGSPQGVGLAGDQVFLMMQAAPPTLHRMLTATGTELRSQRLAPGRVTGWAVDAASDTVLVGVGAHLSAYRASTGQLVWERDQVQEVRTAAGTAYLRQGSQVQVVDLRSSNSSGVITLPPGQPTTLHPLGNALVVTTATSATLYPQ